MNISVIIPLYNAEDTIINTIKSVVGQSYQDFEIIIVNDGSTDNSPQLVQRFIADQGLNGKITLINKNNGGVSSARNLGIRAAKGKYIALIDSDDIWLPEKLKHQLQVLLQYDADFIGSLHNNLSLGFPYKLKGEIFEVSLKKLLIKMAPSTITALFKKSLIEKAGFYDENQKYTEDGNLWFRFCLSGKMIILNKNYAMAGGGKPLYGHSGLSGNLRGMYEGEKKNLLDILKLGYINKFEYYLNRSYIWLKFQRRLLIVSGRKHD